MLEQISENDTGILNGSVLGRPSNWRTAKFVAKFTNSELLDFGVEGVGNVSATSAAIVQKGVMNDDRMPSNAPTSEWNDPDGMPTPSQNRAASTSADPEQTGSCIFPSFPRICPSSSPPSSRLYKLGRPVVISCLQESVLILHLLLYRSKLLVQLKDMMTKERSALNMLSYVDSEALNGMCNGATISFGNWTNSSASFSRKNFGACSRHCQLPGRRCSCRGGRVFSL
jgi:hypothetical protein